MRLNNYIFDYSPLCGDVFKKEVDAESEWGEKYNTLSNRRRIKEIKQAVSAGVLPSACVLKVIAKRRIISSHYDENPQYFWSNL